MHAAKASALPSAKAADAERNYSANASRYVEELTLLDLTLLAPDLQLQVLNLEAVDGVELLAERQLRAIVAAGTWPQPRAVWARLAKKQ